MKVPQQGGFICRSFRPILKFVCFNSPVKHKLKIFQQTSAVIAHHRTHAPFLNCWPGDANCLQRLFWFCSAKHWWTIRGLFRVVPEKIKRYFHSFRGVTRINCSKRYWWRPVTTGGVQILQFYTSYFIRKYTFACYGMFRHIVMQRRIYMGFKPFIFFNEQNVVRTNTVTNNKLTCKLTI